MHLQNKLRDTGEERGKGTSNVSKEISPRRAAPGSLPRWPDKEQPGNQGAAHCGHRFSALRCPASAAVRPPATLGKRQLSPSLQPSPPLWPRSSPNRPSSPLSAPAGRAPSPLPYLRLPPRPRRPPSSPGAASPGSGAGSRHLRSAATGAPGAPAVAAGSKATYMVDAASRFPRRLRPLFLLLSNPQFSRAQAPPSPSRPRRVRIRRPGKRSRAQIESSWTI